MMTTQPVLVKQIDQKDNYTFTITWSDGQTHDFRLSTLQRVCPCANCLDEKTGQRLLDQKTVKEDVRAVSIRSIGRYALQIQFTSGCSLGIYSFDTLRQMHHKEKSI